MSMLKFSNNASTTGSIHTRWGSPLLSMSPHLQMVNLIINELHPMIYSINAIKYYCSGERRNPSVQESKDETEISQRDFPSL